MTATLELGARAGRLGERMQTSRFDAGTVLPEDAVFHIVFNAASGRGDAAQARREIEQVLNASRTASIFVGNNPLQLERVGLDEAEDVQRGRLAAVIVKPVGTAQLFWLAVRGALGQLGEDRNVRNFAFRSMTVRPLRGHGSRGLKVAVDGEVFWMPPPLRFTVAAQPLMLIVPEQRHPGKTQ